MKLSIFTVSTPDMTPDEMAEAAKQAGIHAIEWRYKEVPKELEVEEPSFWRNNRCTISPSGDKAYLQRFIDAAEKYGLETLSVTPYLTSGDLEGTEKVLQTAQYLGAPFIRLGVHLYNRSRHFSELFELQRQYLRQAEALCRQYKIKGLVETHHKTIACSASAAYRLCEGLDPDCIGVLYDPGNLVHEGYENYRMGLELLGPYLSHVHVKNTGWRAIEPAADGVWEWKTEWAGLTRGVVPWKLVIDDLIAIGYEGYLGLEDFSKQFDSRQMLRHFADYMNRLIGDHAPA